MLASSDIIIDKLLPPVLKHCKDQVPNIRFVSLKVAKTLQKRIEAPNPVKQINT
jgi:serine/threonine-protein phosphatase 2A regulatory subunit A